MAWRRKGKWGSWPAGSSMVPYRIETSIAGVPPDSTRRNGQEVRFATELPAAPGPSRADGRLVSLHLRIHRFFFKQLGQDLWDFKDGAVVQRGDVFPEFR